MDCSASYYDILGVTKEATDDMIREAYRKLALRWHPDKNLDNTAVSKEKFTQISEAYQVLSNKEKRINYDRHCYYGSDSDENDFGFFMGSKEIDELFFCTFFLHKFVFERGNDDACHSRGRSPEQFIRTSAPFSQRNTNERGNEMPPKGSKYDMKHVKTTRRTVNGKKWVTKTFMENGCEVVERYEDDDLIMKRINGVNQKIGKK